LERWEKLNPRPTDEKEAAKWEKLREQEAEALVISGHKNIDINEVFGTMAAKIKDEQLSSIEQAEIINKRINDFTETYKQRGGDINSKEYNDIVQDIRDLSKQNFQSKVEIKAVVGLFYKAMKEGRPIILDEINAIPHTALIAINDLLTMRPPKVVTPIIPGIEPFEIAEGFCVFATGNWKPEDGKTYFGRQSLDAAFLSRFGVVSYDYLPERLDKESKDTEIEAEYQEKADSELTDIMVAGLLDKGLGMRVPEGTLQKIRCLARGSRLIQNIFSEKAEGEVEEKFISLNKTLPLKKAINENVLSIRHLLPILKKWKSNAYNFSLEHYILDDYLHRSSGARPIEKLALYKLLQSAEIGLFKVEEGWPDAFSNEGEQKILNSLDPDSGREVGLRRYDKVLNEKMSVSIRNKKIKMQYYSPKEIIEELFGKLPERKEVPKSLFEKNKAEEQGRIDTDLAFQIESAIGKMLLKQKKMAGAKFSKDNQDKDIIKNINYYLKKTT
jgi:MoxR-like ATPase